MPGPLVRWFYTHVLRDRFPSTRGQRRRDSPRLSRPRRRGKLAARPRLRDLYGRRRPLRRAPRDLGPVVHGAGAGGPRQLAGHHPSAVPARHLGAGRRRRAAQRRPGAAVLAVGRRGGLQRDRAPRHRALRVEPVRVGARHRAGPGTGVRGGRALPAVADASHRDHRPSREALRRHAAADAAGRPPRLRSRARPRLARRPRRRAAGRPAAERQPVHLRRARRRPRRRADVAGGAGRGTPARACGAC